MFKELFINFRIIQPGLLVTVGRDSSVGVATRYGLDSPGIESRWGRDFLRPSRSALRPTQPPVQWVPGLSRGVKRPRRGAYHLPPSKCRGHERVGLYLYSPSGPQWPVIGRTFYPFTRDRNLAYDPVMLPVSGGLQRETRL